MLHKVEMVTNWTINGGRSSSNLYHVSKDGAEYAERNIHGTMGNLLNSYNQNKGINIIYLLNCLPTLIINLYSELLLWIVHYLANKKFRSTMPFCTGNKTWSTIANLQYKKWLCVYCITVNSFVLKLMGARVHMLYTQTETETYFDMCEWLITTKTNIVWVFCGKCFCFSILESLKLKFNSFYNCRECMKLTVK